MKTNVIIIVCLIVGLVMIFVAVGLALPEFLGAKKYCNSINGDYSLELFPKPRHLCNSEELFHYYNEGWGFDKEIVEMNWSLIRMGEINWSLIKNG